VYRSCVGTAIANYAADHTGAKTPFGGFPAALLR